MFVIELDISTLDRQQSPPERRALTEDYDDIQGIFADICEFLSESGKVVFRVHFGHAWPVDIDTDLLTIIGQVPEVIRELDENPRSECRIDFYEQGTEKTLVFLRINAEVKVKLEGRLSHGLQEASETLRLDHLLADLRLLIKNFILAANKICPHLSQHALFQDWCRQAVVASCLDKQEEKRCQEPNRIIGS